MLENVGQGLQPSRMAGTGSIREQLNSGEQQLKRTQLGSCTAEVDAIEEQQLKQTPDCSCRRIAEQVKLLNNVDPCSLLRIYKDMDLGLPTIEWLCLTSQAIKQLKCPPFYS